MLNMINVNPPHFVLFPFLAQGHMIPMVDIAKLLATQGVVVTILLTPQNENRVRRVIDRAIASGLTIRIARLKIPVAEAGLPEGSENLDMLSSVDDWLKLFNAISMLREQVDELLQALQPSPTCLIADMCYPWATNLALKLHIPRLVFHGTSCFSLLCFHILATSKRLQDIHSNTEYFVIPDVPDRIEITKAQMRGTTGELTPEWVKIHQEMAASEDQAFGTVANTFQELEPAYVEKYIKAKGKKAWCIGPVSLSNNDDLDKAERGGSKASIDHQRFLKWLDSHETSSVVYVCLGSLSCLSTSQLIELGLGLEASNRPFIWVMRDASDELKAWLLESKFEERSDGRGLLIQGWAPQVLILSHPSVGAFVTHCGWNSTLEGVTAGLPMITWPVFAEQFCNEKLIVNVIRTGVRVGVEIPVIMGYEESVGVQVKSEDIKMAIEKVMEGGEEGKERRERAWKLREMAKNAVEEGGSSYHNLTQLIQDVIMEQAKQADQSANVTKLDEPNSSEIVVQ